MMSCFIEIEKPQTAEEALPEWIECYVIVNINPKICGPLAGDINAILPLRRSHVATSRASTNSSYPDDALSNAPMTDHLKRIRRRPATADEISYRTDPKTTSEQPTNNKNDNNAVIVDGCGSKTNSNEACLSCDHQPKRPKESNKKSKQHNCAPWSLDILVGSVVAVEHSIKTTESNTTQSLASILMKHSLSLQSSNFLRKCLPGRPARTKEELDHWNKFIWPTLFYEEKTVQYKEEKMALASEEVKMMKRGMNEAIKDAISGRQQWEVWNEQPQAMSPVSGAAVINPLNGSVVSRASEERQLQSVPESSSNRSPEARKFSFPEEANPLCSPVLFAIQGVSRREREVALGFGMESKEFRTGQYLCTGCDVYLTKEPDVYEAMALVHSRVRRVVFGIQDKEMGGLGGASANATNGENDNTGIHSLPGTNHHYRAFRLNMSNDRCSDEEVVSLIKSLRDLHS